MRQVDIIPQKIISNTELPRQIERWKFLGKKIGFTNGVFDILHQGHIFSLSAAAKEAEILIVGLNSDDSVKRLKGESRPVNDQQSRALVLASLLIVDAIVIFDTDTPRELILQIEPDVLIKGGDYTVDQIAGASEVIASGGRVVINPLLEGFSTTSIIQQLRKA